MSTLKKVLNLLSLSERRGLLFLVLASIVSGLTQIVGMAFLMPFLSVVADPEEALLNPWLLQVYELLGFASTNGFLIFLGVAVFAAIALSNGVTAFTAWLSIRFSWDLGHNLSERLLKEYLSQPYEFYIVRNSSELGTQILSEVWEVVQRIVLPAVKLISQVTMALFILGFLIVLDPVLAMMAAVVLGGLYATVFWLVQRRLEVAATQRVEANRERFLAANEAFGGIKAVKILGKELTYLTRFVHASKKFVRAQAASHVIRTLPTYALELIAFGGIVLIVLYLLATGGSVANALPLIGVYAFASYRLTPALKGAYSAVTSIRDGVPSLDAVMSDSREIHPKAFLKDHDEKLPLGKSIELKGVSYAYPGSAGTVLHDIDMSIAARSSVAIVGPTGSGKTTLVDIIMGLLKPHDGAVLVDGETVSEDDLSRWQKSIGYVPQHIYLSDISVAWNIAFGVDKNEIDMSSVERAARDANIHDFIMSELSDGYETTVGERGVRLSGGQMQRIGIARALYTDPEVLILDEATSALDGRTEHDIYEAVEHMRASKTIVIIAHRLDTVKRCDTVFVLDAGRIVASGSYEELLRTSETFRQMALANETMTESADAVS